MLGSMRRIALALCAAVLAGLPGSDALAKSEKGAQRPNFLIIVADDLGWSDLGAFGGEIATPNLDALAMRGVRFTDLHAEPACSPTRAELLTGVDHHIAGLGAMAESMPASHRGKPGYEGHLNENVATVAELLKEKGYRTFYSGKWHLGLTVDRAPAARGFERSFALLPGGGTHFGAATGIKTGNAAVTLIEDKTPVEDPPKDYYSSDYFTDKMIGYLAERPDKEKPFFAFLAFQAPHWPLQAPDESIAKYKGRYDAGPDVLRERRLAALMKLGLVPEGVTPHPVIHSTFGMTEPTWSEMTRQERKIAARRMEVYAAMVDRMDENIGRLIGALSASGDLDKTVVIFLSDNGAEGNRYENVPFTGGGTFGDFITKNFDNSLKNMGRPKSFVWYGPHWGQAASAPSRHFKHFTTQGGLRVPAFITYPGFARQATISHALATVRDVAPTVLDMAGVRHPRRYQGRKIAPMTGRSMVPLLRGEADHVYTDDDAIGWELHGRLAIRKGMWKAVKIPPPEGPGAWQLYDLSSDPGEINDLSGQQPARLADLLAAWDAYRAANNVLEPVARALELESN